MYGSVEDRDGHDPSGRRFQCSAGQLMGGSSRGVGLNQELDVSLINV